MRTRVAIATVLVLGLPLSGCSYQTANSPKGGMSVEADFTDVQNLAIGHGVHINNVRIGTVTGIHLIGSGKTYRVRVDMSLKKGVKLPAGTTAELSVTSLLGENYVALVPPSGSLQSGSYLADHALLSNSSVVPAFEQVVGKAGPLLEALSGNDLSGLVATGAQAFGGRGEELQKMIGQVTTLSALFATQRAHLDDAVTQLASLGHQLAAGQDALGKLPATLAATTKTLADDRDDLLDTISKITDLAKATDDNVLAGNVANIRQLLDQLGPVISTLASNKTNLDAFIEGMQAFVAKLPKAVYNGQLLLYPVLSLSGIPGINKLKIPVNSKSKAEAKRAQAVSDMLDKLLGGTGK